MSRAALIALAMLFLAGCDDEDEGKGNDASITSITLADGTTIEGKDLVVKLAVIMLAGAAVMLSMRVDA